MEAAPPRVRDWLGEGLERHPLSQELGLRPRSSLVWGYNQSAIKAQFEVSIWFGDQGPVGISIWFLKKRLSLDLELH